MRKVISFELDQKEVDKGMISVLAGIITGTILHHLTDVTISVYPSPNGQKLCVLNIKPYSRVVENWMQGEILKETNIRPDQMARIIPLEVSGGKVIEI